MDEVAVRSFRLWKLKEERGEVKSLGAACCSSFVPIVETERLVKRLEYRDGRFRCSSFVPIVETESFRARTRIWSKSWLQFVRSDCGN